MELIFEKSEPGKSGVELPENDVPVTGEIPEKYQRRTSTGLPNVSEPEVVRHYTQLSQMNFGIDSNFYPLGSCTMKYNPKFTEKLAGLDGFANLHPWLPYLKGGDSSVQGALELVFNLKELLCELTGMHAYTTQPLAGAHGELTGTMMMAAYHRSRGEERKYIIVPDSCHGTNPASAAIAGFNVKTVTSDENGVMDLEAFKEALDENVAGVMLTCPNTLGVFNPRIREIADLTHDVGGLMYYDGANLNAYMGIVRPGELGFDIVHLNLHKTFGTPHGGGGPGSGPVGVSKELTAFLPIPRVIKDDRGNLKLSEDYKQSIGKIAPFYGNFGVLVKAYAYILALGKDGLRRSSEEAVLNANYIRHHLQSHYEIPHKEGCLHEFVVSATRQAEHGVQAVDIAKALIDRGIHPPTVYFPSIVKESMMVEPTETESKESLDRFIEVMKELAELAQSDPESFHEMPKNTPVSRPDETKAARQPDLAYFCG